MVNRASALVTNYKIGSVIVNRKITLTFQEIKNLDIKQIGAWPSTLETMNLKLADLLSVKKLLALIRLCQIKINTFLEWNL